MTLKRFLDCAYAILIEERQRLGIDLITALEDTREFARGGAKSEGETSRPALENERALAEFNELTKGLGLG